MSTIVLGTIDAGGDGKAVLMASVNSVLGSSYTLAQFDFGVPELVGVALPTRNSVVKLAPKAASGYYGTRKVYYNRIHASDLGVISVQRGAATRVSDLLESINEKYGILITVEDIYDALLPVGSGEVSIALDFRPSSFVYYGGTYVAIGTNDPNGGTGGGVSAPFVRTQTLFGFDTETLDSDWIKVDGFSVAVDADKSRKRYASMNDNSLSFTNVEKRTWDPNWYDDSVGMQPVVGGFTLGNGSVRTVDAYGRVMELDAVSTGWGGEVGDVMSGVDMSDRNTLQLVQQKLPVRLVLQSSDTTVYVLKVWGNTAQWVRSTDNGVTWSVVGGLNAGITKLLNYTEHDSYDLQIVDSLVHNEVIFCLLRSESGDWSVESFNIGSGECTVSNISVAVGYGSQELDYSSRCRMSLMAPTATMTSPLIAMVAHLDDANQPALYIAEKVGNNYTPYAVASGLLEFDFLTDSAQYVTGYSVPLAKNPAWRLDVIELGTHVPTPIGDAEYASAHRKRTVNGFMTYGLKTLTSIHNGTARSKWVESDLALPGVHTPKSLRLYSAGKFMQYHAQPENALVRVNYTENTAAGGFVGTVDNSIVLEKNNQYRKLSPFGLAPYTSPVLTENSVMNYQWLATSDVDSAKAAIEYSYIAKTAAGVRQWWVAGATGVPLTLRSFGIGYSNIGTVPVAVGNMDNDLLALTDGQTIHRSSDAGRHWTTFTGARSYYQQRNDIANQDVVSTGVVPWVSDSIKSGSFLAESAIFEVDHAVSAGVMERNAKAFNTPWVLTNHGLLRFSTDVNMQSDEHQTYALGVSYGINYLEENQPFRLRHWETDANNNIVLGGDYTVNALEPYAISDENIPPTHTVPVGATLVDIKRSIGYMDSTEFLLIKAANGKYTLECLRESGAVNVFELFGGTRLATSAFIPQVSFFLWDHQDTNYVPLVYCANKSVVLVERITEDTNFAVNIYHLTVPQDNGTPLIPVPMLNKNRREYQFYQKGNGIFGLVYAYNNISKSVTFTLNKLFSLSDAALNTAVVLHGCKMTTAVAVPPTDALIPTYPAAGTLVSFACSGTTKVGTFNDGNGGVYQQNIEANSPDCGYVAPAPGPVTVGSTVITINTDTNGVTHTDTIVGEDGESYIVYEFDDPLNASTDLVFDADFNANATIDDIDEFAWKAGTGNWEAIALPATVTVPQGTQTVTLRVKYVEDLVTEGIETYDIILEGAPGNTQITSAAIVTTMTIQDTSVTPGDEPLFTRFSTEQYNDDFSANNKGFDVTPYDNTYGAFFDPRLEYDYKDTYGPAAGTRNAVYDAAAGHLSIEQHENYNRRNEMWLRPINPESYTSPDTMVSFKFKPTVLSVIDEEQNKITIPAGAPLPLGCSNVENRLIIGFANTTTTGTTWAKRGVHIVLHFASEGNTTVEMYARAGVLSDSFISPYAIPTNGDAFTPVTPFTEVVATPNDLEYDIKAGIFFDDTVNLFRGFCFLNGVEVLNFTVPAFNADPSSSYVPMVSMHSTPWIEFDVEQFSIDTLTTETFFPTAFLSRIAATNGVNITQTESDEHGYAYVAYAFDQPLDDTCGMVISADYNGTATAADILETAWRCGPGAWNVVTLPAHITVPQGVNDIALRLEFVQDNTTEGDETFDIILDKESGNTKILNPAISTTLTIADSSTNATKSIAFVSHSRPSGVSENQGVVFNFALSASNDTPVGYNVTFGGDVDENDIESFQWSVDGNNAWVDFTGPGYIIVPANTTTVEIRVVMVEDATTEGDEAMSVTLTRQPAFTEFDGIPATGSVTVLDTSLTPVSQKTITFMSGSSTATANEGQTVTMIWNFSEPLTTALSLDTVLSGATASDVENPGVYSNSNFGGAYTDAANYTPDGQIHLGSGTTSLKLELTILNDNLTEGEEILTVTLTPVAGTTEVAITPVEGTVTINDTSLSPTGGSKSIVYVQDYSTTVITEGHVGQIHFSATEPDGMPSTGPVTINFTFAGDIAAADFDSVKLHGAGLYNQDVTSQLPSGSFTFPAGLDSFYFEIAMKKDFVTEGDEEFTLSVVSDGITSSDYNNVPAVANLMTSDLDYNVVAIDDNYATNNKNFKVAPYDDTYGAFFDPTVDYSYVNDYGPSVERKAVYNVAAGRLDVEQQIDTNKRDPMVLRPINPSTYGAKETLLTFKFKPTGIVVNNDIGSAVLLPAGQVLPEGYTYQEHIFKIIFFNKATAGTAAQKRSVGIRLNFASDGASALTSFVRGAKAAGTIDYATIYNSEGDKFTPDVLLPQELTLPNETEYTIETGVVYDPTYELFRFFFRLNGVEIINFGVDSGNAHPTSTYVPLIDMSGTAWAHFGVTQYKIETR